MRPTSTRLAHRIDVMLAFQNGDAVQFRHKTGPSSGVSWRESPSNSLMFRFDTCDYRIKPKLIEGYVDPLYVHPHGAACGDTMCIKVRQVEK